MGHVGQRYVEKGAFIKFVCVEIHVVLNFEPIYSRLTDILLLLVPVRLFSTCHFCLTDQHVFRVLSIQLSLRTRSASGVK